MAVILAQHKHEEPLELLWVLAHLVFLSGHCRAGVAECFTETEEFVCIKGRERAGVNSPSPAAAPTYEGSGLRVGEQDYWD